MSERSESTKRGLRAEELVRSAVGGRKGICDVHTHLGGFEVRWGPTTKNSAGLNADRTRAKAHGGYCVQITGPVRGRKHGDRSLFEFLIDHGYGLDAAQTVAGDIRLASTLDTAPQQLRWVESV